ncbi:MAG: hypothetical protein HS105_06095 [Chloracidobacterium sp.]|nr:hypothetical protein [Chloracidobacterium sp.]
MKNITALFIVLAAMSLVVLGCSWINPLADKGVGPQSEKRSSDGKTTSDNRPLGDERIGVPECDEVMDMLTAETNSPDDNFVTKAFKATFFNKIRETIRQAVEDSKKDNTNGAADLAKTCRDLKQQLEKFKAEEKDKEN